MPVVLFMLMVLMAAMSLNMGASTAPDPAVASLLREYGEQREALYQRYCNNIPDVTGEVYYVCTYLRYRKTRDGMAFAESIPTDPSKLEAIWNVDEETAKQVEQTPQAFEFLTDGSFSFTFVDSIVEVVRSGNATALDRLFCINESSDGEFAEYVADKILDVFETQPEFILTHWDIVARHEKKIGFESTDIEDKRGALQSKYARLCKRRDAPQPACRGVGTLLQIDL
jgi:hypothetical protein